MYSRQHVLIFIGISGSGKSTLAKQFVLDDPTYLRLNRDDLRRSVVPVPLGTYWKWEQKPKDRIERLVSSLEKSAVQAALEGGWNLLVDNTHLRQRYINELLKTIADLATPTRPIDVSFQLVEVPLDIAIARDRARTDVVGETVIREQYNRLQLLRKQFNHRQHLTYPIASGMAPPMVQDERLPRCIIVDIDGTAAKIHDRSPFDWANVGSDLPNQPVLNVVRAMRGAGYAIVFLSGRDSAARDETIRWLARQLGWQEKTEYTLFMRARNDNRKDAIIKRELFEAHIQGRYFVECVLDDRDQVVSLWRRDLGLTCFQVDYGNF